MVALGTDSYVLLSFPCFYRGREAARSPLDLFWPDIGCWNYCQSLHSGHLMNSIFLLWDPSPFLFFWDEKRDFCKLFRFLWFVFFSAITENGKHGCLYKTLNYGHARYVSPAISDSSFSDMLHFRSLFFFVIHVKSMPHYFIREGDLGGMPN